MTPPLGSLYDTSLPYLSTKEVHMTRTELDRYYDKKVVQRDGVKGQICQGCQQWIPLEEKGQHFEAEHLK